MTHSDMKFYDQFTPFTELEISQLEEDLEVVLPPDYRNFLMQFGGGQPECTVYESTMEGYTMGRIVHIDVLHGNYQAVGSPNIAYNGILRDRVPSEVLVIGDNGGGSYLCIGVKGKYYGQIWMWYLDHQPGINQKPTFKKMELIAPSFTVFIEGLRPEEDE